MCPGGLKSPEGCFIQESCEELGCLEETSSIGIGGTMGGGRGEWFSPPLHDLGLGNKLRGALSTAQKPVK